MSRGPAKPARRDGGTYLLVSINIEDLYVLTTVLPHPLNRSILEHYIQEELKLLTHSYEGKIDTPTLEIIIRKIDDIRRSGRNLKGFFPNIEIKESALERASFRLFHPLQASLYPLVRRLVRSDLREICDLRQKVLNETRNELNEFDPLQVVGAFLLNIAEKVDRDSFYGLRFFRTAWENKKPREVFEDMFSGGKFGPCLFEMEDEILNETYRQVLLTSADMQRRIRRIIAEHLTQGHGRKNHLSKICLDSPTWLSQ